MIVFTMVEHRGTPRTMPYGTLFYVELHPPHTTVQWTVVPSRSSIRAGQPTKKTTTQMDGRDLDGGA